MFASRLTAFDDQTEDEQMHKTEISHFYNFTKFNIVIILLKLLSSWVYKYNMQLVLRLIHYLPIWSVP